MILLVIVSIAGWLGFAGYHAVNGNVAMVVFNLGLVAANLWLFREAL